ncbi:MAG: acyl carrier protein [Desulfovibrio sp.]
MDKERILATIQEIVRDTLGQKDLVISAGSSAKNVERWDSVSNIGIILGIEQEFGFRFQLGELDSIENVGDIVEAVIRHA